MFWCPLPWVGFLYSLRSRCLPRCLVVNECSTGKTHVPPQSFAHKGLDYACRLSFPVYFSDTPFWDSVVDRIVIIRYHAPRVIVFDLEISFFRLQQKDLGKFILKIRGTFMTGISKVKQADYENGKSLCSGCWWFSPQGVPSGRRNRGNPSFLRVRLLFFPVRGVRFSFPSRRWRFEFL